MDPILYRLQAIFREVFDQPALVISADTAVTNFSDWDSVAMVQIVLAVESEFKIRFSTDQVAAIRSVADLLAALAPPGSPGA